MKVTIYPYHLKTNSSATNPYIADFIRAMEQNGITISNPPHKNPLIGLLPRKVDSDVYIFHWLENVPDYKYGMIQFLAALLFLANIRLHRKKIIWFMHNKQPHTRKHAFKKQTLIRALIRSSDLIVTHATEGLDIIRKKYPHAAKKAFFFHHPTKIRMEQPNTEYAPDDTDLLIWGGISHYKRIPDFVLYHRKNQLNLKTKIIGKCSSPELLKDIRKQQNEYISLEDKTIRFEELNKEIRKARFVLVPYAPDSILSSGILMDSLSFGAKVIGPDTGSFRDYADNPDLKVFTFKSFDEIPSIIARNDEKIDREQYIRFLNNHSWEAFGKEFSDLLKKIISE